MIFIFQPLLEVFFPSILTILTGFILDFTLCQKTLKYYFKEHPDLYIEGVQAFLINLLVISPMNYLLAYNFIFSPNMFTKGLHLIKLIMMLLIHNVLYYFFHMSVHKIKCLKFIHNFHHKFKINLPSIGNSVSILEFQFMYIIPFLIGLFFVKPNILTFNASIYIISFLNLLIHCNELKELKWISFFVSPNQHCKHHLNYFGNYSAPLINFDILNKKK